jgi:hypothetical protein
MRSGSNIDIQQVENGFIVRPLLERHEASKEVNVFQTMAELIAYIEKHFDHRCDGVRIDQGK